MTKTNNYYLWFKVPPPQKIDLVLKGKAKEEQSGRAGIYSKGNGTINGHPYWVYEKGEDAIWMDKVDSDWNVGAKSDLGSRIRGIEGPSGKDKYPTQVTKGWRFFDGTIWHEAPSKDVIFRGKFIVLCYQINDSKLFWLSTEPPPIIIELVLDGKAKEKQSGRAGIYKLNPGNVNGFPHWLQENGTNAIWFSHTYSDWRIGPKTNLGTTIAGISGLDRSFSYPTKIDKWYYYGNGTWTLTDQNEIKFIGKKIWNHTTQLHNMYMI